MDERLPDGITWYESRYVRDSRLLVVYQAIESEESRFYGFGDFAVQVNAANDTVTGFALLPGWEKDEEIKKVRESGRAQRRNSIQFPIQAETVEEAFANYSGWHAKFAETVSVRETAALRMNNAANAAAKLTDVNGRPLVVQ